MSLRSNEGVRKSCDPVVVEELSAKSVKNAFVVCGLDEEAVDHCRDLIETIPGIEFPGSGRLDIIRDQAEAFARSLNAEAPDPVLQAEIAHSAMVSLIGSGAECAGFVDCRADLEPLFPLGERIGFNLIVVVRDPRDTASSRRYAEPEACSELVNRWCELLRRVEESDASSVLLVHYEDLAPGQGMGELDKIARFLNLIEMPKSVGIELPVDTGKPLPDELRSFIEAEAGEYLATLNY